MKDNVCRNCGSEKVISSPSGFLAPFFVKRVFGLDIPTLGEEIERTVSNKNNFKGKVVKIIYRVLKQAPLFSKLFNVRCKPIVSIRVCINCGFVGPEQNYSYELLSGLYHDYRSSTYNKERCIYEPAYKGIQNLVGKDKTELKYRLENIESILKNHVKLENIQSVLDWGGGGRSIYPSIAHG